MQIQKAIVLVQTVRQLAQATVIKQMVLVLELVLINALHVHLITLLVRVVRKGIIKTVIHVLNVQREHINQVIILQQQAVALVLTDRLLQRVLQAAAAVKQIVQPVQIQQLIARVVRKGIIKMAVHVNNAQQVNINQVIIQPQQVVLIALTGKLLLPVLQFALIAPL